MSSLSNESIYVLRKLYSWNKIVNKYINLHDVIRVFPKHLRNRKLFRNWVKDLIKLNLVIIHKNGTCISLNKHKLDDIESIVH